MSTALITGASGFAGPYLAQHLSNLKYEVVCGFHNAKGCPSERYAPGRSGQWVNLDVTNRDQLRAIIAEVRPAEIYHLAGLTRPTGSSLDEFYKVNFGGALNLLEAVREEAPQSALLLVTSAYVYGRVGRPITETRPLKPVNHYGVSKAAADHLAYCYAQEDLKIVRARPFNHTGPGQGTDFILPALIQQFVEIEAGKHEPTIRVGNLDSVRDFSDVRDIVRAYALCLQRGRNGEAYNLGSGTAISIRDLFKLVSKESGTEADIMVEPLKVRATDIPYLVADASKARGDLGWETRITLRQTVRQMLESIRS